MSIDPHNPVVQLCVQGVELEMKGDRQGATVAYHRAWEQRANNFEACIAAHYMARVQSQTEDRLHWNLEAVVLADKADGENMDAFYPSLYLNLGKSYEDLGDVAEAERYYHLGEQKMSLLPNDRLGNMTREGILRGLERVRS